MAILWQSQGGMASKILQWRHDGKLLDNGDTACDGNAMVFLEAARQCGVDNDTEMTTWRRTPQRWTECLPAMAMLWQTGGSVAVWR